MAQTIRSMLKEGQQYMHIWPTQVQLNSMFPDSKVIAATRLSIKVMPALAVLSSALLVNIEGLAKLPQAIAIAAFFLSLPLQGLVWLGHRSSQVLPKSLTAWYLDIHHKMQIQGCALQAPKGKPTYKELARLLNTAFSQLDKAFTQRWF